MIVLPFFHNLDTYYVTPKTWTDAFAQATQAVLYNTTGFLATVTSAEEHNVILSAFGTMNVYLGGSDSSTEGSIVHNSHKRQNTNADQGHGSG